MNTINLLQKKALNSSIPLTDILRIAYTIAVKLKLDDFQKWLSNELYGYENSLDKLPQYRYVHGVMLSFNPTSGWNTVRVDSPKLLKEFDHVSISENIAKIEHLLKEDFLYRELPLSIQNQFAKQNYGMRAILGIENSQLAGILDVVRTKVLNWALELEQKGILGEDMDFNEQELKAAQGITINNYIVGNNASAPILQGNNNVMKVNKSDDEIAVAQKLLTEIKKLMNDIPDGQEKSELKANIATIESQLNSPKPNKNILREGWCTIRNVLEGASGSLLASMPTVTENFTNIINKISDFI